MAKNSGFAGYVKDLFDNPELSDVTILLDNDAETSGAAAPKTFHGHRVILATMSDYFRTMLFGPFVEANKREIRLRGVPYSIFMELMRFVYFGWTNPDKKTLDELVEFYSLARMLLLDSKMDRCFDNWISYSEVVQKWEKDLLKLFSLAFEWNMASLKRECEKQFSVIANEYLTYCSFMDLPPEVVRSIVRMKSMNCTGAELKHAVKAWIKRHKGEISTDFLDDLMRQVALHRKLCYKWDAVSLYPGDNQQEKAEEVPFQTECLEPLLEASHEYSYSSELNMLACVSLKGVKICLRANQQFGPQYGRIKSKLRLCLEVESARDYNSESNYCKRNLTVRYDFTKHEQTPVTIFFPSIDCCKGYRLIFNFKWKGTGVQPLLQNHGPTEKDELFETESSYVTHIIFEYKSYDEDDRCSNCPSESDHRFSSSYYDSDDFRGSTTAEDDESGSGEELND